MKIPALALALVLVSCGPAEYQVTGTYQGEVIDHHGRSYECTVEITATALDRVHIHLDYGSDLCDGDGATVYEGFLLPDAGGEILLDTYALRGNFFSAYGGEYCFDVVAVESPEGAK